MLLAASEANALNLDVSIAMWGGLGLLIIVMATFDLVIYARGHVPSNRENTIWSIAWIAVALLFGALFWAVLGPDGWLAFTAGFLAGYLAYDMIHYHVHHHRPRTAVGRRLRELHMRHHFQDHDRGFGVSAPWWDHVFGTAPRRGRRREAS